MKHYGDICAMNGAAVEPVDVVTFGAPCQDLSVAGKRAGMKHESLGDDETTRSGLFYEAVRVIKEMRSIERANGRTGMSVRPRYGIYENVPGALSSNSGRDWQAVLTELVRVAEPDAPEVPLPDQGKWPKCGVYVGDGWSVAYNVHDAQYYGVPQRRRRVCVLCDWNGLSAAGILYDAQLRREAEDGQSDEAVAGAGAERRSEVQPLGESLPGDTEPGGEARQGAAEGAARRPFGAMC